MKTQIFKTTIATLLLMIIVSLCDAQNKKTAKVDTSECLQLSLKITDLADQHFEGCQINIYQGNTIKYSIDDEQVSKYELVMNRNTEYTIEINYPGYLTRRVTVSTQLPKGFRHELMYQHEIDIAMIPEVTGFASEFLDFPAGMIVYNIKSDLFESDKKYMNCLKKDFDQAKESAKKVYSWK